MNMKTIILSFLCISVASTHAMIASEDGSRVSSFFKTLRDDVKSVVSRDCNREQKQRLIKQAAVGGTVLVWCALRGTTKPKIIPPGDQKVDDPSDTQASSDEGEGAKKDDQGFDQDKDEHLVLLASGDESSSDLEDEFSQASGDQSDLACSNLNDYEKHDREEYERSLKDTVDLLKANGFQEEELISLDVENKLQKTFLEAIDKIKKCIVEAESLAGNHDFAGAELYLAKARDIGVVALNPCTMVLRSNLEERRRISIQQERERKSKIEETLCFDKWFKKLDDVSLFRRAQPVPFWKCINEAQVKFLDKIDLDRRVSSYGHDFRATIYSEFDRLSEEKKAYFAKRIIDAEDVAGELIKIASIGSRLDKSMHYPFAQIINFATEDELARVEWNERVVRIAYVIGPTLKDKIIQCNFSEESKRRWPESTKEYDSRHFEHLSETKQQYFRTLWPDCFKGDVK